MTEIQISAVVAACSVSFLLGAVAAFISTDGHFMGPVIVGAAASICALVVSVARILYLAV
jgi:hypothetical protein